MRKQGIIVPNLCFLMRFGTIIPAFGVKTNMIRFMIPMEIVGRVHPPYFHALCSRDFSDKSSNNSSSLHSVSRTTQIGDKNSFPFIVFIHLFLEGGAESVSLRFEPGFSLEDSFMEGG